MATFNKILAATFALLAIGSSLATTAAEAKRMHKPFEVFQRDAASGLATGK